VDLAGTFEGIFNREFGELRGMGASAQARPPLSERLLSRPHLFAPNTRRRVLRLACAMLHALLVSGEAAAQTETPAPEPGAADATASERAPVLSDAAGAVPGMSAPEADAESDGQPAPDGAAPTGPALAPGDSGEAFAEQFGQVLREAMPEAEVVDLDGRAYTVTGFDLYYREANADLPAIEGILPITVQLQLSPTGYIRPREGEPSESVRIDAAGGPPVRYHASAIGTISRSLLTHMHDQGLLGVYVQPSQDDIDITTEQDLRREGNQRLRIGIWVGRIRDVRTIAAGDRIKGDWRVDNPVHRRIRAYSPLHPPTAGHEETTDLLQKDELEEYLFLLNRHPGRHVEAALAASEDEEGISLDYRVYESKPWSVYAQVANTGTERTSPWQTRVGLVHRQVTDRDDIFSLEYLNAGLNNVHGVTASYDAPWFAPKRPYWMETSGKEPPWLGWADRSKIPWWGLGRLRWRVGGGWTRIETDEVCCNPDGSPAVDSVLSSDWNAYGRLTYNAFQHRAFFLDAFGDGRFRGVSVDNANTGNVGDVTLFSVDFGLQAERINQFSTLLARLSAEYTFPLGSESDYEEDFASNLGRARTDERWWALKWNLGLSYYLEPLLNQKAWRDPNTASSSTLSHELALGLRGQYAFDYRLIPQSSQVIGGQYSVRGFPQGQAVGDSVYLGSLEYRFHIPRMLPVQRRPMSLPWVGDFRVAPQQVYGRPDWDLVLRAFVDAGQSVRNDRIEATGTELNQTLVGAGVGLEFIYKGNARIQVDWGRGLYKNTDGSLTDVGGFGDASCARAKLEGIDSSGEFYFLFSVMY
jgi:hemolysin activation/secretion protein